MDASIFLLRDIEPVADAHAYHGTPREHTRHKIMIGYLTPATCAGQLS